MKHHPDALRSTEPQQLLPEETRIVATLLSGKTSLKRAIGVARDVLGNPLILSNRSLRVIAHTDDDPDDWVWQRTVENGHVPLMDEGFSQEYRNIVESGRPVVTTMPHQQSRMMIAQVCFGSDFYGFVTAFECCRGFTSDDERILGTFAKTAGRILHEKLLSGTYRGEPHEQLLADIIGGYDPGSEGLERLRGLVGLRTAETLQLLVVRPLRRFEHPALPLVKLELEGLLGIAHGVALENAVLHVLDAKQAKRKANALRDKLKPYCKEKGLIACFSREFEKLGDMKGYYEMASAALDARERLEDTRTGVFSYDDYMPYHLLRIAGRDFDLERLITPEIAALAAYDRKSNAEMARTLDAFYDNACDITKTAKALHLHYNTVDYRLRRISEICGIDVRNASGSISLRISLIIDQYLQATR